MFDYNTIIRKELTRTLLVLTVRKRKWIVYLKRVPVWWVWIKYCKELRDTNLSKCPNLRPPSIREYWEWCHVHTSLETLLYWSWDPFCKFPSRLHSVPFSSCPNEWICLIQRDISGKKKKKKEEKIIFTWKSPPMISTTFSVTTLEALTTTLSLSSYLDFQFNTWLT